jgi:hypothetical protein
LVPETVNIFRSKTSGRNIRRTLVQSQLGLQVVVNGFDFSLLSGLRGLLGALEVVEFANFVLYKSIPSIN